MKKEGKKSSSILKKITIPILLVILFLIIIFFGLMNSGYSNVRPEYCKEGTIKIGSTILKGECIPDKVFAKLPPYPKNLGEIKIMIEYNKIKDLTTIEEEYYKQPEFYLNWNPSGINSFFNPPGGYFGAFGFGAYPGDTVATMKPGESLKLGTFFRTSWGVETYQGMQLASVFPENAESITAGLKIEQDPKKVRDYFDVSIEPSLFVLEPSFGVFEKDWARKITVIIRVKQNTPSGKYVVGITPIAPPSEKEDKWLTQYGLRYVSAGSHGVGRPFYQVFIEVQE
jgi:hypothetical protein